jgi:hypothetical protein
MLVSKAMKQSLAQVASNLTNMQRHIGNIQRGLDDGDDDAETVVRVHVHSVDS